MAPLYGKHSDTIKAAMDIVDPHDGLTTGSAAYRVVIDTIAKWIEDLGPEETLKMAEQSKAHLQAQVDFLSRM